MTDSNVPELLPCPFCGAEDLMVKGAFVVCSGRAGAFRHVTFMMNISAWNTRTDPTPQQAAKVLSRSPAALNGIAAILSRNMHEGIVSSLYDAFKLFAEQERET